MRVRRLNHSVYQVNYHLVWGTKYRRQILTEKIRTLVIKSFLKTQRHYPDWYFHYINTGADHIHILMEIPPKYAVAEVVQKLKCHSSLSLKRLSFINKVFPRGSVWSVGYFVSTVGLNEQQIAKYIENQNLHDRGTDASAELS